MVGGPAEPWAPLRPPLRWRLRGGLALALRPPLLAGTRGALLPPHSAGPPCPPLGRREPGWPASGCCPHPPPVGSGDKGFVAPPPTARCDTPPGTHRLARLGVSRFAGLEASGPRAGEGRVPSTLGGAAHRRAAGGPLSGRACDAGRACPSQEDNAAAPAREA